MEQNEPDFLGYLLDHGLDSVNESRGDVDAEDPSACLLEKIALPKCPERIYKKILDSVSDAKF